MTVPQRRRGLGRGLDALLSPITGTHGDDPVSDLLEDDVVLAQVPIGLVDPNPEQPRTEFDQEPMEQLASSIRDHGVLQPVVVERDGLRFRLVAGERRLRAARLAGLTSIPAVIRPTLESSRAALELALIENLQRADLGAIEEATAFQRLADAFGLTPEAIGLRVGRSRPAVANTMRLLALSPPVQAALRERRLSAGQARALLALPHVRDQEALAAEAEAAGLTVRQVEQAVAARLAAAALASAPRTPAPGRSGARPRPSADDTALCAALEEHLGTPVRIERRRRGGRVVIDFYDNDHLHGLYEAMGGSLL